MSSKLEDVSDPTVSNTPNPSEGEPSIGPALREVRRRRGLSLQQVALATGISKSFLSLVENGTNDITFGRLRRLIDLYGIDIADLLPVQSSTETAVRRSDRKKLYSPADGIDIYLASPDTRGDLLAGIAHLAQGSAMTEDATHPGDEWVHVTSGVIDLVLDHGVTTVRLQAGDSAYLRAGRAHRFGAPTEEQAEVITVLAQGSRWRPSSETH
ncbi:helix-turn-helix domain-containing protein [Rhodococcus sp. JS3073]|uniref:helix-turn-helix domain-containing protein n=1 Tax=Rhodococcus sp. JS3073 TaxID=3002901 RepID=UPI00228562BE|nr:XRE family transcriptional regulator [Rhodococcus sp. JS3073]WAM19962.1 XRE family transcriptional regulator [Rhodococcus sp. JS3073]